MTFSEGDRDIVLLRDTDKALLFNTELIPLNINKSSGGVQVFTMKKKSVITRMFTSDEFISDDIERLRIRKLTSSGYSLTPYESEKNNIPGQIKL